MSLKKAIPVCKEVLEKAIPVCKEVLEKAIPICKKALKELGELCMKFPKTAIVIGLTVLAVYFMPSPPILGDVLEFAACLVGIFAAGILFLIEAWELFRRNNRERGRFVTEDHGLHAAV